MIPIEIWIIIRKYRSQMLRRDSMIRARILLKRNLKFPDTKRRFAETWKLGSTNVYMDRYLRTFNRQYVYYDMIWFYKFRMQGFHKYRKFSHTEKFKVPRYEKYAPGKYILFHLF